MKFEELIIEMQYRFLAIKKRRSTTVELAIGNDLEDALKESKTQGEFMNRFGERMDELSLEALHCKDLIFRKAKI